MWRVGFLAHALSAAKALRGDRGGQFIDRRLPQAMAPK
jgi:hypothetical protein